MRYVNIFSFKYAIDFMNVPAFAKRNELMPEYTFQYQTVPQRYAAFQTNEIRVSLGRMLGGTSQINYSIFNRGNPQDYDNWANYTGDPSWNYDNLLPYFKRAETYYGEFPSGMFEILLYLTNFTEKVFML